ncbi:putative Thioredoxin domain-containing protein [Helianthus anomalus]
MRNIPLGLLPQQLRSTPAAAMTDATTLAPVVLPFQTLHLPSNRVAFSNSASFSRSLSDFWRFKYDVCTASLKALSQQRSIPVIDSSYPVSVDLKPILNECQFDHVIHDAQRLDDSVVVLWMAKWCRKCIYLKPTLEKLAADYHPRVKFYCIDVNNVPYQLVVRAGVTLWKDGKKQAEVIGGHKAYLVANEVREMIDDEAQP